MPRLNTIDPARAEGKVREIFDGPLKGKHINIFKGLANSPAALDAYVQLSGALAKGTLSAREREVVALTLGQLNDCGYCVAAHTVLGKMAGLTEPETVGARTGRLDDPKLAALSRFVRVLYEKKGFAGDADVKTLRSAGYNDGHIAEIIAVYALNIYTNYFNHVNETAIDFPPPPAVK